jgi:NNP family nitrate/nitrite transporter-like MFS transporter
MFVAAVPASCMPALFKEISDDLNLSLVQIGTIWGAASLAGIFVSLLAGVLSDRFGLKFIMGLACVLAGITGALRGVSETFLVLMATVFLNGVVRLIIPITATKAIGLWFKGRNLGSAMGISAGGMGFGLMLGPMISATILSPWLGGWRNVLYLYGGVSVVIGLMWFILGRDYRQVSLPGQNTISSVPFRKSFSRLIRNKAIWIISFVLLFRVSTIQGMTGYLPIYLRGQGWSSGSADGALSAFYAVSALGVIPLSLLSDRLSSRKVILLPAVIIAMICVGILPFVQGTGVWALVILSGLFFDGFMAVFVTMLLETEGIGPEYSGTALGIVFTIAQIGCVIAPPIGNSFAGISPGTPFIFWASLSIIALIALFYIKDTGRRRLRSAAVKLTWLSDLFTS